LLAELIKGVEMFVERRNQFGAGQRVNLELHCARDFLRLGRITFTQSQRKQSAESRMSGKRMVGLLVHFCIPFNCRLKLHTASPMKALPRSNDQIVEPMFIEESHYGLFMPKNE
jgi:hypothetical protein